MLLNLWWVLIDLLTDVDPEVGANVSPIQDPHG